MNDLRKQAQTLAEQPYTTITFRDVTTEDEPIFVAFHPELPGCVAQGETSQEAQVFLAEVRVDYIEHLLEHNLPVPLPQKLQSHLVVMLPGAEDVETTDEFVQPTSIHSNDHVEVSIRSA